MYRLSKKFCRIDDGKVNMWIMDIEMPVVAEKILLDVGLVECSNRRPLFE